MTFVGLLYFFWNPWHLRRPVVCLIVISKHCNLKNSNWTKIRKIDHSAPVFAGSFLKNWSYQRQLKASTWKGTKGEFIISIHLEMADDLLSDGQPTHNDYGWINLLSILRSLALVQFVRISDVKFWLAFLATQNLISFEEAPDVLSTDKMNLHCRVEMRLRWVDVKEAVGVWN